MAIVDRRARSRRSLLPPPCRPDRRAPMAAAQYHRCPTRPHRDFSPNGPARSGQAPRVRCQLIAHGRTHGLRPPARQIPAIPPTITCRADAVGGVPLVHQYRCFRVVVLAVGRRRPSRPRLAADARGGVVPVSADDHVSRGETSDWSGKVAPQLHGLLIRCVQHEHGVFPYGHASAVVLGQVADDGAVDHLAHRHRCSGGSGRQPPLAS